MRFLGVLALAVSALWAAAPSASATTVDFTGAGVANGDDVSHISAGGNSLDFDTRDVFGKFSSETVDHVDYWNDPNYSHDNALFSVHDGEVFQLTMTAGPGQLFTSVAFNFGGFSNADRSEDWAIWGDGFNFINSGTVSIDGDTGGLVSLTGLNNSQLIFQFGTDWNGGLQSLSFTTVAQTPIPAALLLFGTALASLGGLARRRRAAA
jgi:hypothetical protein